MIVFILILLAIAPFVYMQVYTNRFGLCDMSPGTQTMRLLNSNRVHYIISESFIPKFPLKTLDDNKLKWLGEEVVAVTERFSFRSDVYMHSVEETVYITSSSAIMLKLNGKSLGYLFER